MTDAPLRILVVDDELGVRLSCRKILISGGFDVEIAEDGIAGLAVFQKHRDFAAALIDLKMPNMGGLELIERIRRLDEDIVLLVITAYATIDTAVEATKRGAYGYVPKPFTPDELLLPVRQGLEKRALALEAKRLREEREKRLLEVAFERSKCNTVIRCMTDGVLVVNRELQVVLRNAAAGRMIPGCADLHLPASLNALGVPALADHLAETIQASSGPMIVSKEIQLGEPNSPATSTYMVSTSPVIEFNGETLGAVAVLRDITALKKLETAKSMFMSMMAHEVKGPLSAVEGLLNVVSTGVGGPDPARDRHMVQRALMRVKALRTMFSEMINLTSMETGHFALTRVPLDIRDILREVVQACKPKADEKGIELTLEEQSPGEEAKVLADRNAMSSVFTNLVDNAIKYTPAKASDAQASDARRRVSVCIECVATCVKVRVRDNGIGMTAEEKERIFEEFYRAKNEYTARVPGTGLGLAIVKRLLEMHQGEVTVQSTPRQGSEFTVRLPLAGQE